MTAPESSLPTHKDDFDRVYDLEDPSVYFAALRPADYRMPAVLAGALRAIYSALDNARDSGGTIRLLDFACGYGVIGALLRHDVSMHDIYTYYARRSWHPADGRIYWEADAKFFAARPAAPLGFEIAGTDIAGVALEYAAELGFLDRTFHENVVDDPPSASFRDFLREVDLVVESGSLGAVLPAAFERILNAASAECPPWFLYSPRPDTDWEVLDGLWRQRAYRAESLSTTPVRYRKPLGEFEHADMFRITRALGKSDESVMRDGYLLVNMTLARPEAEAGKLPIEQLQDSYD